jgi:hypothetical protein
MESSSLITSEERIDEMKENLIKKKEDFTKHLLGFLMTKLNLPRESGIKVVTKFVEMHEKTFTELNLEDMNDLCRNLNL